MAVADTLTPVAPAPVYTHRPLFCSASPPASLHLFSPGITLNVLIWKQVQERHIFLSRLGVCTRLFLPTLPYLPFGMMSSVRTISASSCTAMPGKRVYPSTYSSLPPYGAAASPASLSRKLEHDMLLTQLLIILLAFCGYNFCHYFVFASCNITSNF